MRLANPIALMVCAIAGAMPSARAQSGLFNFLDLSQLDTSELTIRETTNDPPAIRESEAFLSARNAPDSPDPGLGRPVSRIGLDTEGLRALPTPTIGNLRRVALPLLEFTVAGNLVRMLVVEARTDRDFDAVHYTLIAPDSDDFARLTVSRSGPEVVGTFVLDDREFRLLPETDDYQLIYPVVAHVGRWRRENLANLETRAGQLEARHLQMGWIADNRPGNFDTRPDGRPFLYADGPSLGRLDFWGAYAFDREGNGEVDLSILAQEIETWFNGVPHFTWVSDPIEVEVLGVESTELTSLNNIGLRIQMRQLINGIPISETLTLRMMPSIDVIEFSGTLMRLGMAPATQGELIGTEEAIETSRLALVNAYGIASTEDPLDQQLLYNAVSDAELELIWRIQQRADCGLIFAIEIDAVTGHINGTRITDSQGRETGTERELLNRCRFDAFFRNRR